MQPMLTRRDVVSVPGPAGLRPLRLRGGVDAPGMLHAMQLIRAVETALMEASLERAFEGPLHVSLGQEAVAVGMAAAMGERDVLVSNHRGHGHALAFGLDPARVIAEVLCHPDGYAGGLGGSMHIFDPVGGFLGTNGIVGAGAGLGTGAALALKHEGGDRVAVSVFGDGAMGTGIVYEAMNLARLWSLPVVFICENNGYAEMTPTSVHLSSPPLERAAAFGLLARPAKGDDVEDVRSAVEAAVREARGGSPAFVEVRTHRWTGHYVGDPAAYRPVGEAEEWRARHCPIRNAAHRGGGAARLEEVQRELNHEARALVRHQLRELQAAGADASTLGGRE